MAHDLRFALRMIFSHPWFSAAVVATLALGIGLNTMVFTLVNAALFKPVPVPGGARLVAINNRNVTQHDENEMRVSYPDLSRLPRPGIFSGRPGSSKRRGRRSERARQSAAGISPGAGLVRNL